MIYESIRVHTGPYGPMWAYLGGQRWKNNVVKSGQKLVLCAVRGCPCLRRHLPEPCLGTAYGMNVPHGLRPLEDVMSSCLCASFVCADMTRVWRWLGPSFCSGWGAHLRPIRNRLHYLGALGSFRSGCTPSRDTHTYIHTHILCTGSRRIRSALEGRSGSGCVP